MYIFCIVVILLYVYLFKRAAGSLSLIKLNMISITFYSILFFQLIGGTIVYLGFRNHYLIEKVTNDLVFQKTYYILVYAALMIPITIIGCQTLFKKYNYKEVYKEYLTKKVTIDDTQNNVFILISILGVIGLISMTYVFYKIGYIPFLKYFTRDIDFGIARIQISRGFSGNVYVKNIGMSLILPLLSYISYVYWRVTKSAHWRIIFIILFVFSILAKTYDFSKSPIIWYFLYFYIIEIILGNVKKVTKLIPFATLGAALVGFFYYVISGFQGSIVSLTNGPLSRILISQVSTLFLHVEAFPSRIPFLNGQSFPQEMYFLFNTNKFDVRSGREVMMMFGQKAVEQGTAGVMSTLFIGEAYANFGYVGVLVSPIILGIMLFLIMQYSLMCNKTPLNIVLYLEFIIVFTTVIQGGFVDLFYNVSLLIIIILIIIIWSGSRISMNKLLIVKEDEYGNNK